MLRSLVIETYGGKVDNDEDFKRLTELVNSLLVPAAYDEGFDVMKAVSMDGSSYSDAGAAFTLPATTGWKDFEKWITGLPEREPPTYLGLPADAEKLLLVEHGRQMIGNMAKVMRILDESEQIMAEATAETS